MSLRHGATLPIENERSAEEKRMTGDDHERRAPLLTTKDVAALNRAREVLRRLEDTAWRRSLDHYDPFADVTAWDLGRLSAAASAAEDAVFHVLSTARANCGARITDAQLRGTTPTAAARPQPTGTAASSGPIRAV
jgi:hypothetical protein